MLTTTEIPTTIIFIIFYGETGSSSYYFCSSLSKADISSPFS
uniref:Uncharacterized protein n=1 Tax=Meloidogyne enterolobii TaxID=390850 RepID=A0A6V7XM05_MELEN|nr:unnamed protein product [Meloidogyne enterolobii]